MTSEVCIIHHFPGPCCRVDAIVEGDVGDTTTFILWTGQCRRISRPRGVITRIRITCGDETLFDGRPTTLFLFLGRKVQFLAM